MSVPVEDINVRLGSADRTQGGSFIKAKKVVHHEKYTPNPINNDVAIIFLSEEVQLSDQIKTIELADKDPAKGAEAFATGWGKLDQDDPDNKPLPEKLQGVVLSVISRLRCKLAYPFRVYNTNICAYTPEKDTCQGDSGGPLVVDGKLSGIVSWGRGCAQAGAPGVYASAAAYRKWIEDTSASISKDICNIPGFCG